MSELQRILRRPDLEAVTGFCSGYIDELVRADKFPKPIKLGERASGWLESEIAAWQRERIAERDAGTAGSLSQLIVDRTSEPGRYAAGNGLYLQVSPGGSKQWLLRYMLNGRSRSMGLGSVAVFSLIEARERARDARQKLADGIDPIDARES